MHDGLQASEVPIVSVRLHKRGKSLIDGGVVYVTNPVGSSFAAIGVRRPTELAILAHKIIAVSHCKFLPCPSDALTADLAHSQKHVANDS